MSFLSLPTELLLDIGEHKCLTRKDHWSLILVNQRFFAVFMQILCREIRIKFPRHHSIPESRPSFKFALGDPILQAVLERLESSPQLRSCVRKCRIDNLICRKEWVLDPLFTLIGQFIHLDSIYLSSLFISIKWMGYLARQPELKSIELSDVHPYNKGSLGSSFSTISLTTDTQLFDPFTLSLTFGGSLVHLRLPEISLAALTAAHGSSNKPILKSLRYLAIGTFGDEGFHFLSCTPNLMQLEFVDKSRYTFAPYHTEEWNKVLPKLETIKCLDILAPHFTRGRSVTSICFNHGIPYGIPAMPKYFGSNVPVKRLYVGICGHVAQLLAYLIADNDEIEELAIIYQKAGHKSFKDMENIIVNCFSLLRRLAHLRILQLKDQAKIFDHSTPSLDDYEEEQKGCEQLRAKGCPNIAMVCFSARTVWNFRRDDGLWKREEWPKDRPLWSMKYE